MNFEKSMTMSCRSSLIRRALEGEYQIRIDSLLQQRHATITQMENEKGQLEVGFLYCRT
jgi:hypothetical protein